MNFWDTFSNFMPRGNCRILKIHSTFGVQATSVYFTIMLNLKSFLNKFKFHEKWKLWYTLDTLHFWAVQGTGLFVMITVKIEVDCNTLQFLR